jgi:hypothetical protein
MQATTPFQADCARKAGGLRDYRDRKLRAGVCGECLRLRKYHFGTGCKYRRMKDREWADYCGVEFATVQEEIYLRQVVEATPPGPGQLAGHFYFRLECGHQEDRFLDRMAPKIPQTLRCASCAKEGTSSQTAVAGSKTLEEEGMEKVTFEPNVPIEAALRFSDGRLVEGRFGDQMQYSLSDGRVMYLDLDVSGKLNLLQLRKGEPFIICKRTTGKKGAVPQWEVYRPGETARPAPRVETRVDPATGIDESDLERDLRLSKEARVAELRATIARLEAGAGADTPAPVATASTGQPTYTGNGNGNASHVTNGAKPYQAAGIPAPPVKIPYDVAFRELLQIVVDGLKAAGEQWSDAAKQDAVSTLLIQSAKDGFLTMWNRGVK